MLINDDISDYIQCMLSCLRGNANEHLRNTFFVEKYSIYLLNKYYKLLSKWNSIFAPHFLEGAKILENFVDFLYLFGDKNQA